MKLHLFNKFVLKLLVTIKIQCQFITVVDTFVCLFCRNRQIVWRKHCSHPSQISFWRLRMETRKTTTPVDCTQTAPLTSLQLMHVRIHFVQNFQAATDSFQSKYYKSFHSLGVRKTATIIFVKYATLV